MFSSLLLFILAIGVAAFLFILFSQRSKPTTQPLGYPYERQPALFTPAERSFLGVLERALDGEYSVFGKVNLADVIKVRRGLSNSERQSALNRINRKHLDFVICKGDTLDLICAIELDDKSHDLKARKERDAFLDEALGAANVPIVRFPAQ